MHRHRFCSKIPRGLQIETIAYQSSVFQPKIGASLPVQKSRANNNP